MQTNKTRTPREEQQMQTNKTIPELSLDARLLKQRLDDVKEDEEITYDTLSEIIGRNVQNGARGCLYTALRLVRKENGAIFATVRGVGLKRLHNKAIAATVAAITTQ